MPQLERTTLAGGCFWCIEAVFLNIDGIETATSGYAGGHIENPSYEQVCSGTTGHAEAVQLSYNPSNISCREILEIFFTIHDPTTRNRQGADIGTQYRSAIFYHNMQQKSTAETLIKELDLAGLWNNPIVTELIPFTVFYTAEEYHQNYYEQHPAQPYCQIVISPKLDKLRNRWAHRLKY
jgi:peptide-methionine (S)-S-oxide reductase